jgi:hypothetical protein
MADAGTEAIPLYPEERDCDSPSAPRIFEIFAELSRHHLRHAGRTLEVFDLELTDLQGKVLDLLGVPRSAYAIDLPTGEGDIAHALY